MTNVTLNTHLRYVRGDCLTNAWLPGGHLFFEERVNGFGEFGKRVALFRGQHFCAYLILHAILIRHMLHGCTDSVWVAIEESLHMKRVCLE